jgi:hypothetical protein
MSKLGNIMNWENFFLGALIIVAVVHGCTKNPGPSYGESCGPHHHWVYVSGGPFADAELSCEDDDR